MGFILLKWKHLIILQEKVISMMENSIQRINNLIDIYSDFQEQHQINVPRKYWNNGEEYNYFYGNKIRRLKINYHVKLGGNPIVNIKLEAINIILINLIENAVDAFPAASRG